MHLVSGKVSMPIYTYRCDNCGVQFDRQQHFDDPLLKKCPECGKLKLRKVFLPVGIVFKGSGFYATDHQVALRPGFTRRQLEQILQGICQRERIIKLEQHLQFKRRLIPGLTFRVMCRGASRCAPTWLIGSCSHVGTPHPVFPRHPVPRDPRYVLERDLPAF